MHDLIKDLKEYLQLTPEQQFRVSAKIKRHIHEDKAMLLYRLWLGSAWGVAGGTPEYDGPSHKSFSEFIKDKYDSHEEWSKKSDEDILTWSVGTHVYKSPPPKCNPGGGMHQWMNAKVGDPCLCGARVMEEDVWDKEDMKDLNVQETTITKWVRK